MFHNTVCILEDETPKVNGKTALLYHWGKFVMDSASGRCLGALAEEIPVNVNTWQAPFSESFSVGDLIKLEDGSQLGQITALRLCEASLKVGVVRYDAIVRHKDRKHSRVYCLSSLTHC